jgi:hypothetical protein
MECFQVTVFSVQFTYSGTHFLGLPQKQNYGNALMPLHSDQFKNVQYVHMHVLPICSSFVAENNCTHCECYLLDV